MIEFPLPTPLTDDIIECIPAQRAQIEKLMGEGDILSYSVAQDRTRVWAVAKAESEIALMQLIGSLPLTDLIRPDFAELAFYMGSTMIFPSFSQN